MAQVIAGVIDQHSEEAAFLWLLRDAAVTAPHFLLRDLVILDARVEAHLDGLRSAGEAGWETARLMMALRPEPGEVFVAAVLAFESGEGGRIQTVLDFGVAQSDVEHALAAALGWLVYDNAAPRIRDLLASDAPALRRVGLAAMVLHRQNPGPVLATSLNSDVPSLKAQALRAVGELGLTNYQPTTRANLRAKDPLCQFWAAWSSARLGPHKDSVAYLQQVAEAGGPAAAAAAKLAMRRLPGNDAKLWLKRLVRDLGQTRVGLIAAGALADPEVVPFLIDKMKHARYARIAGESFSLITGANIAYDKLEGGAPEGVAAGPTEDPGDENVAQDADGDLAWPDQALVHSWWASHQNSFVRGNRYLLGRTISPESLRHALKDGYQRQRNAAALELALLQQASPLFDTGAPGLRQLWLV